MDVNQATIASSWATIVQAISAVIMLIITLGLAYLAWQQNMRAQTQINLALYERRFKIYNSSTILINSIMTVSLPKNEADNKRFIDEIGKHLQIFWIDSREKVFILDDDLNEYVDSIEKRIKEFCVTMVSNPHSFYEPEFLIWQNNIKVNNSLLNLI